MMTLLQGVKQGLERMKNQRGAKRAVWRILSYNDEGLLSLEKIENLMRKYGKYSCVKQDYQRFKADSTRLQKQSKTIEYLHIFQKCFAISLIANIRLYPHPLRLLSLAW